MEKEVINQPKKRKIYYTLEMKKYIEMVQV